MFSRKYHPNKFLAVDSIDLTRLERFNVSLFLVKRHNSNLSRKYSLAINFFSDWPTTLLRAIFIPSDNISVNESFLTGNYSRNLRSYPQRAFLNWATKANPLKTEVTGSIRSQGLCGACWAMTVS